MNTHDATNANEIRVAVAGSYGFMDIGDEAMLTEDLDYLHHELGISREQIYLFGAQSDYVAQYHDHPTANCISSELLVHDAMTIRNPPPRPKSVRKRIKAALRNYRHPSPASAAQRALEQCDVALITGGGTINTREGRRWSLERIHLIVSEFKRFGLPVFMSGQTIGPLGANREDDQLAREIVEMVAVLTVRDADYSRRYLNLIDAQPHELIETFDDAYCLPYQDAHLPDDLDQLLDTQRVAAVNVTDYTADDPVKRQFVAETIEQLLVHDLVEHVVCVSHTPGDLQRLWMIRDMVQNDWKPRVTVPDTRYWRDASIKRLISRCAIALGGRYHFIVFAGTSNTPFVGMTGNHYSYVKQDGFARPLGLSDFILTEKETWDRDCLMSRVKQAMGTHLSLAHLFQRPSVSMARFGTWLTDDLQLIASPTPLKKSA